MPTAEPACFYTLYIEHSTALHTEHCSNRVSNYTDDYRKFRVVIGPKTVSSRYSPIDDCNNEDAEAKWQLPLKTLPRNFSNSSLTTFK